MIVLKMELSLLASLLLITLFINASECGQVKYAKRSVYGNSVSEPDSTALLSTSCRQTLCAQSPDYPSFAINQVVNEVRRILRSDDEIDLQRKRAIDPVVVKYFSTLQHVIYNYDLPEPDGCDHYLNIFLPEEGYSSDDQRTYYIVNLPSYHQRVESIVCTSDGEQCNNDFRFRTSTCRQVYHAEKLLVLPVNTQFSISDFRVRKFKIPRGCSCTVGSRK